MHYTLFAMALMIVGAILTFHNSGFALVGLLFLIIGVLMFLGKPIKRFLAWLYPNQDHHS